MLNRRLFPSEYSFFSCSRCRPKARQPDIQACRTWGDNLDAQYEANITFPKADSEVVEFGNMTREFHSFRDSNNTNRFQAYGLEGANYAPPSSNIGAPAGPYCYHFPMEPTYAPPSFADMTATANLFPQVLHAPASLELPHCTIRHHPWTLGWIFLQWLTITTIVFTIMILPSPVTLTITQQTIYLTVSMLNLDL